MINIKNDLLKLWCKPNDVKRVTDNGVGNIARGEDAY